MEKQSPSDLFILLDSLGISHQTHEHPPVATVDEATAHWEHIDAVHAKNLFLKDEGRAYWLVAMPADMKLDLKGLPARIGSKRLRFAPADEMERLIGITPGSVSPFALINDTEAKVTAVIEESLAAAPRVGLHPLRNTATTVITGTNLLRFLEAIAHPPRLVKLG